MNFGFVLFLIISLKFQFSVTKWNNLSKCAFWNNWTHVTYECENSNRYVNKTDLSCCQLNCVIFTTNTRPRTLKSINFKNCQVSQLGIAIFGKDRFIDVDFSNMKLELLQAKDFRSATQLQKLNASHNNLNAIPSEIFTNTPKLTHVDFSYNNIHHIDAHSFGKISDKIEIIDLSHNQISSMDNRTFANLTAIIDINLENNLIETIDESIFKTNRNLTIVRLGGNKFKVFNCTGPLIIYELNLSDNRLKSFDVSCVVIFDGLELNMMKYENDEFPILSRGDVRLDEGTWCFDEDQLSEMSSLNISNNQIAGIFGIIDRLGEPLISLDVTGNFLGTLSVKIFAKFINLEELVLRNTSLTNIQYGLFHHQKKLRFLDISYNYLKRIQFEAFSRSLARIELFYLDGNNLTEIDDLTPENFPNITTLGISDNNFTCEYLVNFLSKWDGIELIKDELSNQSHVERIACDKQFIDHFVRGETTTPSTTIRQNETISAGTQIYELHEQYLYDIHTLLIFTSVILSIICIVTIVKYSVSIWLNRKRFLMNRSESNVRFVN